MTDWLKPNALSGTVDLAFDERADWMLRRMDVALAFMALVFAALPMVLGLGFGKLRAQPLLGAGRQPFQRWQIDFADNFVGRLLVKTGLSRWPVLFNILRGEMAWVGPAPLSGDRRYESHPVLARLRPGLVNLHQVRRRTAVDFGTQRDADLEYAARRGVRHDLGLLLRALMVGWLPAPAVSGQQRIAVGDVAFDNVNMQEALDRIAAMLDAPQAQQVSFVNPACVNIAARDRGYRRLLSRAALVLPDGIGIKMAADLLGVPLKQNVNGTDLFPRLCQLLEARDASLFLLGGQPGVADKVAEVIRAQWPRLRLAGVRDGFFGVAEEGEVAAEVRASGADVVLVARGVPMQDVFIDRHLHQLGVKVAMGVGGLFDFVSGRINRAPVWMRDSGLEWVYRLMQEPSRMWRRYLVGNFSFLGRMLLQRLGLRQSANDDFNQEANMSFAADHGSGSLRTVVFATATVAKDIPVPGDFPLALLPYGWRSFIEAAIEQLADLGVRDLDLVVSSRPEELRQLLGLGERWGVNLRWHMVKDASSPYSMLRAMGLDPNQRLLLGQAGRLVSESDLTSLLAQDQIAALADEQDGATWAGWASTRARALLNLPPHSDERALGIYLCQQPTPLLLVDAAEWVSVNNAQELLAAQDRALTDAALAKLPATWLQTPWGAYSPDALVQDGALMARPTLVGPGCVVAPGARLGPGTVLTRDVIVSSDATISRSLVFPDTFIGQGLELDQTLVNAQSVEHLRLGARIVLPASEGLLLDLHATNENGSAWLSRAVAAVLCLLVLPWLAVDTLLRSARGLPVRWQTRLAVAGRDADTGEVRMQTLRCAPAGATGHWLAHYGEWLDVLQGRRNWFGVRPRSQSEWYALGRDWQLLLASTPVGCLHAPAWQEDAGESLEAQAAADVYFVARQSLTEQLRILRAVLSGNKPGVT